MSVKHRLFVAVDVPRAVKDAVEADVVGPLRGVIDGARWTRPEGRHLTLAFLGWMEQERSRAVAEAVVEVASGSSSFEAALEELGGFPNLGRPRVLWVGVGLGAQEMSAVAAALWEHLEPLGFKTEARAFHPHVTLARFKQPRRIDDVPRVAVPGAPWTVSSITLYRSELGRGGARYTSLATADLG